MTLIACLAALCVGQASTAYAIELAPHQVTYQLSMRDANPDTSISAITGKTVFRMARECDGWKSGEDYVMQMRFDDGNEVYLASLFESFEDVNSGLFSFSIDEQSNYQEASQFHGFVQSPNKANAAREAYFSIEPDSAMTLPDDTYFPIAQTLEILKRAKDGERFFSSHIFFGAKPDDALKKTSVIIGALQQAAPYVISSDLLQESYYPVQVAYFDPQANDGIPTYEISFHMQDNGVVPYYLIDYGDFRLQATLSDIAKEPSPTCG